LGAESYGALSVGDGGVNLVWREKILFEKGLQQDAAHLAGAEDGDAYVGQLGGYLCGLNGYFYHF
jgi:hypothetical protein